MRKAGGYISINSEMNFCMAFLYIQQVTSSHLLNNPSQPIQQKIKSTLIYYGGNL